MVLQLISLRSSLQVQSGCGWGTSTCGSLCTRLTGTLAGTCKPRASTGGGRGQACWFSFSLLQLISPPHGLSSKVAEHLTCTAAQVCQAFSQAQCWELSWCHFTCILQLTGVTGPAQAQSLRGPHRGGKAGAAMHWGPSLDISSHII